MARPTLRERQRLAIREEVQQIALERFAERGYEDVSIAEIAEAAGVSDRTVYRYYATKEDIILDNLGEWAPDIHAHLRDHPGENRPWKVLCDAFLAAAQKRPPVDPRIMRMIYGTPKLLTAYFERQRNWENMAAEVIAERLGVDPVRDPRPQLWSMMAFAIANRTSYERVMVSPNDDLLAGLEESYLQAEQLFSGSLP